MAEKKIHQNPLPPETQTEPETPTVPEKVNKPQDDKTVTIPSPEPAAPRLTLPSFTKTAPNDLYRRLLPAVLFLLTFVTVMTMLLIYMDTVALGAQQFRLNMTRDYELARIPQESAPLVAYVRQLHLAPRAPRPAPPTPERTDRVDVVDKIFGDESNGTFIEFLPRGARDPTCLYLEQSGWSGVAVRAAPRDYLAMRTAPNTRALHACLSPTDHPREVTYHEPESQEAVFSSRVLCLPLYTVLLAADATSAPLLLLGGNHVTAALTYLPFEKVHLKILDIRTTDQSVRNKTTAFLKSHNYTVAATFEDGIMFTLNEG